MAIRARATALVVQEGSASSTGPARSSAQTKGRCVDEDNAGSSTPAGCQPVPNSAGQSGAGCNGPDSFKAAKRARYNRAGAVEFEMGSKTCFKGGFLLKSTCLNTSIFHGIEMMKVGGREEWLCQAATGNAQKRGSFEQGVSKVKEQLFAAIVDASVAAREQKIKAATSGRELLDLPASESDSSSSSGESGKGRKPKVDNSSAGTIHNVQLGGTKFKALVLRKRMYVEARADVAQRIVYACCVAASEVEKEKKMLEDAADAAASAAALAAAAAQLVTVEGAGGPEGSQEPTVKRVDNLSGKCIRFDTRRSCYEIIYGAEISGEMKVQRSVKGLYVKSSARGGKKLTLQECDEQMIRAHEKAKKLWNELDRTQRKRYPSDPDAVEERVANPRQASEQAYAEE